MEEDLVDLGVRDKPEQKSGAGFKRLGVWVGGLCSGAWGLFAIYVFFRERVTINNVGFFLFLFVGCLPTYFLPYAMMRAIGKVVGATAKEQED